MELLVVLLLFGIVVAVSVPATSKFLNSIEIRKKERKILAVFRYARLQAISLGKQVKVSLNEDGTVFSLQEGITENKDPGLNEDEQLKMDVDAIVFYPEGMATPSHVTWSGDRRTLTVYIDPLTALPEIRPTE